MVPFGKAKVVQPGTDLTVITYGAVVPRALQAVQKLEREHGVKAELIDLRSLNPFDWETIAASVQKTNRALVAYEDTLSWGYGAEIAARIADQMFEHLDAPVRRVAAMDVLRGVPPRPGKCHPAPDRGSVPGHERAVGVLETLAISDWPLALSRGRQPARRPAGCPGASVCGPQNDGKYARH